MSDSRVQDDQIAPQQTSDCVSLERYVGGGARCAAYGVTIDPTHCKRKGSDCAYGSGTTGRRPVEIQDN
jgi:hypothetical protein